MTVSNIGGIGDGESASPVLVPGGGVAIVAIGRAKWVWDVDRGDGKGERRVGRWWKVACGNMGVQNRYDFEQCRQVEACRIAVGFVS